MKVRKLDEREDMCFGNGAADFYEGLPALRQKIKTALSLWKGEWFLDENQGFPWKVVLGKRKDEALLASLLKTSILRIEGVQSMEKFRLVMDHEKRIATIFVSLRTIYGEMEMSTAYAA